MAKKAASLAGRAGRPRKTPARAKQPGKQPNKPLSKAVSKRASKSSSKSFSKPRAAQPSAEVAALQREVDRLQARLKAAQAQIAALGARADTDFLLDILNRRGFERAINRAIAYLRRYSATAAIVYLDVDGLKPVNDKLGHPAGDELLKAIARVLTEQVRLSDVVARLGGDEFGVLLWNLGEGDARTKARTLEQAVAAMTLTYRGQPIRAGLSAGVTMLEKDDDAGAALGRADKEMYLRKHSREGRASGRRVRR